MYTDDIYILDTETTGLSAHKDKVVQLAFSKINPLDPRISRVKGNTRNNVIIDVCMEAMRERLFNPGIHISDEVIRIHNVTNEMVAEEPSFSDLVDRLMVAVPEGSVLLMHNAPFDIGMIYAECVRAGERAETWFKSLNAIDSLEISRKMFKKGRHNLDALCARLDIEVDDSMRHSANGDVLMLAQCWVKLILNNPQTGLFQVDYLEPRPILDFIEAEPLHASVKREMGEDIVLSVSAERDNPLKLTISDEDMEAHKKMMDRIKKESGDDPIWSYGDEPDDESSGMTM